MGYVAVKGGEAAISESIRRLRLARLRERQIITVSSIKSCLRGLVDRVMSEASLYARDLAALAIKQAEGNPEEATFLLRAYRGTLPRKYYSRLVSTDDMTVERRISATFKDIPGGQLLGASYDYTHRLLDFSLETEEISDMEKWLEDYSKIPPASTDSLQQKMSRVVDIVRQEGLLAAKTEDNTPPQDVTRQSLSFPAQRSERLQALTRGETGAVTALGYAAIRGYGLLHPTVAELRVGDVPITIDYPLEETSDPGDALYIGRIQVTEVDSLIPSIKETAPGKKEINFCIGYGVCYGQNETKAIAMSVLDFCLENPVPGSPVHDEEFVLTHVDPVEATGFISHLKLPHYVTFQSELDSARKIRLGGAHEQL